MLEEDIEEINKTLAKAFGTAYYTPEEADEAMEGMYWLDDFINYYHDSSACFEEINKQPIDELKISYGSKVAINVLMFDRAYNSVGDELSHALAIVLYKIVTRGLDNA